MKYSPQVSEKLKRTQMVQRIKTEMPGMGAIKFRVC